MSNRVLRFKRLFVDVMAVTSDWLDKVSQLRFCTVVLHRSHGQITNQIIADLASAVTIGIGKKAHQATSWRVREVINESDYRFFRLAK